MKSCPTSRREYPVGLLLSDFGLPASVGQVSNRPVRLRPKIVPIESRQQDEILPHIATRVSGWLAAFRLRPAGKGGAGFQSACSFATEKLCRLKIGSRMKSCPTLLI
jgi:hypothetical protein